MGRVQMKRHTARALLALAMAVVVCGAISGCEDHFTVLGADGGAVPDASVPQFHGVGVGETCDANQACRAGLVCTGGKCAVPCPTNDKCDEKAAKKADDACILTGECGKGLHCGFLGFCVPEGEGVQYSECTSASDCKKGLFCDLKGISGYCEVLGKAPKDLGAPCTSARDCLAGLNCTSPPVKSGGQAQRVCAAGSVTLNPHLFPGVACPVMYEELALPFQARTVVPGVPLAGLDPALLETLSKEERARLEANRDVIDFYATPFPNDLRRDAKGMVDIKDHAVPGGGIVGIDLVKNVIDAISTEMTGFSVAPTIFFRFTRPLKEDSIIPAKKTGANVVLVDLDRSKLVDVTAVFKKDRNKYICGNYLAVHPLWSEALLPATTYGAYVLNTVVADLGEGADPKDTIPVQGDHLAILLGSGTPTEKALAAGHVKYKKLRDYLTKAKVNPKNVVAATVFTTMDPTRSMRQLRAAALAANKPAFQISAVLCDGKTKSPCGTLGWDAKKGTDPRGCPATPAAEYHEIHSRVRLPVYQEGFVEWFDAKTGQAKKGGEASLAPYIDGKGGGLKTDANGKPQVVGYEDVCVAVSIPKGTWADKTPVKMPASGWPVVIYAHGTGGSLRSGMTQVGASLARLTDLSGKKLATAVISIDQAMHGSRRGPGAQGQLDPGPLFYNFANPKAAKGNLYQGAADNYQLVMIAKLMTSANWAGTGPMKMDPNQIFFMGHSQGGTTGPLFLPWEPSIRGAVFSGTGGSLVHSLLNKKSPQDATVGVKVALQEVDLGPEHPVLALMQYYFDEVDPLVYGPMFYHDVTRRCGPAGCGKTDPGSPKHILATYGQNDTFTPPATSRVFAASTHGQLLKPADAGEWFDPITDLKMAGKVHSDTAKGNLKVVDAKGAEQVITGASVQHLNDPAKSIDCVTKKKGCDAKYDGHFVAFRHYLCNRQVMSFLATLQSDPKGIPSIPHK